MIYNFKFWLLDSIVKVNDWSLLEELVGGIYDYRLDLTMHKYYMDTLFEVLHWFIDPLYL
jgi:hypothetical protein